MKNLLKLFSVLLIMIGSFVFGQNKIQAENINSGEIHTKIMNLTIKSYKEYSSNPKKSREKVLSMVYDDILKNLSIETEISSENIEVFLNRINYSKTNFINHTMLDNQVSFEGIKEPLKKYFLLANSFPENGTIEEELAYYENLLLSSERELSSSDFEIYKNVIDIAKSSIVYWNSDESAEYNIDGSSTFGKVNPRNKAIIKADVNGAISGAAGGAMGGFAFAGVGSVPGALLGGCMGGALSSAGEGLWQAIGW